MHDSLEDNKGTAHSLKKQSRSSVSQPNSGMQLNRVKWPIGISNVDLYVSD